MKQRLEFALRIRFGEELHNHRSELCAHACATFKTLRAVPADARHP